LRKVSAFGPLLALAAFGAVNVPITAMSAEPPAPARVEARSADLLAVGLAQGDRMTIHLSRLIDNAPVRDAAVTVILRGVAHPTTAEADGSFTLKTKDLAIPGAAAVDFQVAQAAGSESLKGSSGGGCSILPCASVSCGSTRGGAKRPRIEATAGR
jgi:hypothetical protein